MTYTSLPDVLLGTERILTPCDAKAETGDLAVFTAARDITVYIAMDTRVDPLPAWLSGWEDTALTAGGSNDVTYRMYAKDFAEGTTVTLGQNGQSSGCTNYTVFVTESIPAPTTEPTTEASKPITEPTTEVTEPTAAPTTEPMTEQTTVRGDIDRSGRCDLVDVILLQKWLLAVPGSSLPDGDAADLNGDGVVDVFDIALLKHDLLSTT